MRHHAGKMPALPGWLPSFNSWPLLLCGRSSTHERFAAALNLTARLASAEVIDQAFKHIDLLLLHVYEVGPVVIAQVIEFFMQLHNLHLGFQVHFIITL